MTERVVLPPSGTVKGADGVKTNSALVPAQRAIVVTVRSATPTFWICVVRVATSPTVTVAN